MRAAILCALAIVGAAGCKKTCAGNTVFVDVTLDAASASATKLTLFVTVGGTLKTLGVAHTPGVASGGVEIDFPSGYPAGKPYSLLVSALDAAGDQLGAGQAAGTLASGCQAVSVAVTKGGVTNSDGFMHQEDMAVGDGGRGNGGDGGVNNNPDFAGCTTVFVSQPNGDDNNSGCDPTVPVKTILGGLAVATSTDLVICKGNYTANLDIKRAVGLHGGYDCTTWTRTATFGYPTFDGVNETVLQPASGVPISLDGPGVTLDGFTVQGTTSSATANAVIVAINATGTIHDNKITAGSNSSAVGGLGTVGIYVNNTATADIYANLVNGGSGNSNSNSACGSCGIVVAGLAHVHGNTIQAGTGTNSISGSPPAGATFAGAVGLWITAGANALSSASGNAVENNTIIGGSPGSAPNSVRAGIASAGVVLTPVQTAEVDLVGNLIDGGTGIKGSIGTTVGVMHANSSTMDTMTGNRVLGGAVMTTASDVGDACVGVQILKGAMTLTDNMIFGGDSTGTSATQHSPVASIQIDTPNNVIRHNTIFGGHMILPTDTIATGDYASGIDFPNNGGVTNTVIESNLFVGTTRFVAIYAELSCLSNGQVSSWQGNGFAYGLVLAYGNIATCNDGATADETFTTVSQAIVEFNSNPAIGAKNVDNVYALANCGGDTGCLTVAGCSNSQMANVDGSTCAESIFVSYDAASFGQMDLRGGGWKLKTGTPCGFSKSGFDDSATVTKDLYGTTRTAPPSMGAHEFDGTCQ